MNLSDPLIYRECVDTEASCHCSETFYYFGNAIERELELSKNEIDYIKLLQQIIGNFIRYYSYYMTHSII